MSFEFLSSTTYPWTQEFKTRGSINNHNGDRFLPEHAGSKLDMDYYLATHLGLVGKCWGDKLISARSIKGIATPNQDTPPPYRVVAILEVENVEVLQDVLKARGAEIMGDIPTLPMLSR